MEQHQGTAACDKMGRLAPVPGGKWRAYKNIVSPWASVSEGKFETTWLRADGHVELAVGGERRERGLGDGCMLVAEFGQQLHRIA